MPRDPVRNSIFPIRTPRFRPSRTFSGLSRPYPGVAAVQPELSASWVGSGNTVVTGRELTSAHVSAGHGGDMGAHDVAGVGSRDAPSGTSAVHLLGGLYVTRNGNRLEVPEGSKRLLAFLCPRRGPVERCHAAGTLWPSVDDRRAAGNLRSALWRLRGADIDVLEADKRLIGLRQGLAVDVYELAEWASRLVARRPARGDLSLRRPLDDALDLLPGCYDDWAIIERERMRQRMLRALEALSRELTAMGRYGEAVDAALTAIVAEPLRE